MSSTKFYARRDSATTVLRKMGIHSRDYNAFIEAQDDGTFMLHTTRAQTHLMSLKKTTVATKNKPATKIKLTESVDARDARIAAVKRAKTTKTVKTEKTLGISGTARKLIAEGNTNQEVWAVLKEQFNLDDSKKHYPTWYRCEMKRTGLLPKD